MLPTSVEVEPATSWSPVRRDSNLYPVRYLLVFISRLLQFLTLRFFGLVLDLVMYCRVLLYSVGIGPTACLHRYLLPIIAGTNTAFYLMVLFPIQLYEYH